MSDNQDASNSTRSQLNNDNFKLWKKQLFLLLQSKELLKYITTKQIEKVDGSGLSEDEKKKLIPVADTANTFYKKETTSKHIKEDSKTKEIIMNSVNDDLAESIDFISLTAYEVYELISSLNECDEDDRIEEIKDSLNKSRYEQDSDEQLSLFISKMEFKFKELENLKAPLNFKEKFEYLYNSIPEDLAIKTNLLEYQVSWEETKKHLIQRNIQLKRLNEKKNKQINEDNNIISNYNVNNNNKNKDLNKNYNNDFNKNKKNIECWKCGRIGHYMSDCDLNNKYYKNKNFKNYKNDKNNKNNRNNRNNKNDKNKKYKSPNNTKYKSSGRPRRVPQ
jgi:hypothetical protein